MCFLPRLFYRQNDPLLFWLFLLLTSPKNWVYRRLHLVTTVCLWQSRERIAFMPGFSVFPNAVPPPHLLTLTQQGSLWKGHSFDGAPVRAHQNNQLWERQVPCAPLWVHMYPSCCIHATVRQGSCLLCESSLEVCSRHPGCDIAMEEEDLELGV